MKNIFMPVLIAVVTALPVVVAAEPSDTGAAKKTKVYSLSEDPAAIKPLSGRDGVTADARSLRNENEKLQTQMKALQVALANAEARARALGDSSFATAGAAEGQTKPNMKELLERVEEKGEDVFFSGIGEARMATVGDFTMLRFPLSMLQKTDAMFSGRGAVRQITVPNVYYAFPSKLLAL